MTKLLSETGLVDVYRQLRPDTTEDCYTWWSNRGQAWAKNVGWRLDYQIATAGSRRRPAQRRSTRTRASVTTRR